MRRRSGDVFELGEEQLLDEPAVELSDAEDPLAIPPNGGGPADEERGPAPTSVDADVAQTGRRPLILDAIGRAGGIRSAAALALCVGVVAVVAAALSADSDEASAPKRPEGRATLRTEIAAPRPDSDAGQRRIRARTAQREKMDRASETEPKRAQAAPSDAGRFSPAPGPDSVQPPNPAPVPTPAPVPSEAAAAEPTPEPLSRGEILYREFGP